MLTNKKMTCTTSSDLSTSQVLLKSGTGCLQGDVVALFDILVIEHPYNADQVSFKHP